MANQIIIDIGAVANDGTGDPLRTAFGYVNDNFSNVWATGVANSNIQFSGNKILTTNTNGNLVLAPNGTGKVQANVDIVPNANNTLSLGATDRRWNTVYARNLDVNGNTVFVNLDLTGNLSIGGNLTVTGNIIEMGNIVTDAKTIQLANTASTANAANGSGVTVGANDDIATMLYSSTSNTWVMNIGANVTGNITAPYFIGNGSQLTGITSYANANAVAYGQAGWAGNIIPSGNSVYSLGNATNRWANLWLSGNTIQLGDLSLSASANGLTSTTGFDLENSTAANIEATGNITANNFIATEWVYGNLGVETQQVQFTDPYGFSPDSVNLLLSDGKLVYESTAGTDGGFVPSADDSETIGRSDRQWSTIYGNSIYANVFYGNGSQLTGLSFTSISNDGSIVDIVVPNGDITITADSTQTWSFGTDGTLTVPGDIVPAANNTQNLGSANYQWNDLYLSNATIYMNNVPISLTAGNVLTVDGEDVVVTTANGTVNLGNLTVNDYNIYNAAGQGVIISNFSFVDEAETAYVQIPAGNSSSDLNVVQEQGNVRLVANAAVWNLDTTGNLTIPNGGYINFVNTGGITQAVNEDLRFTVSDDEEDGWAIQSTVNDGAGNDLTRMQVRYDGVQINTDLPTNNYNWTFRDSGEFDVPGPIRGPYGGNLAISIGDQFGSTTFIDLQTRSYVGDALISNIRIGDPNVTISTSSGAQNWTFGSTGNLTVPNSILGTNSGAPVVIDAGGATGGYSFVSIPSFTDGGEQLVIKNKYNSSLGIRIETETGNFTFSGGSLTFPDSTTQSTAYTGATYGDSNVTSLLSSLGSNTISSTANITTTANISGGYILGNAAFMTGIPASYGNANVADFLDSLGSNAIVTTGNISGGNLLASGYANITGNINGSGATFSGNVTAANFSGNISITGNVTGTSPNVSLVAGSYTYTFDNTGVLSLPAVGGNEGGEINFAIPTANTTLTGPVKVDVYQDRLRFFDGNTNGAYLDLANCPSGVSAAVGYRDIPQISFSANATATGNAAGCHYYSTTAGNLQLTIPDNANVAFPTGATLTVVVNAAGNVIVAQGTGVTLYMAGSSTTGNRTVGAYGLASVMKVAANTWVISGTGVY